MIFKQTPFELTFLQKEQVKDSSDHLFSLIYSFKSTDTKLRYILRAEYHVGDIFALKFYAKNHKLSDFKYSLMTNRGYSLRIFLTCAKLVPVLLHEYPGSSFGLIGSRSIDRKLNLIEPIPNNRRFKIYSALILELFGDQTFEHYDYPKISGYLLLNRSKDIIETKQKIEKMFFENYSDIHVFENLE